MDKSNETKNLRDFFESILDDVDEKRILNLVLQGKEEEFIIDELLQTNNAEVVPANDGDKE